MVIYAGIDEAGYGPMLGPLCVACTVFEVAERAEGNEGNAAGEKKGGAPDLWRMLGSAAARAGKGGAETGRAKKGKILVDDSKKLKGPRDGKMHPLKHLERGVLAFLPPSQQSSCIHRREKAEQAGANGYTETAEEQEGTWLLPRTDEELMRRLGCDRGRERWWEKEVALPVGATEGELRIDAARMRRALGDNGVRVHRMRCEAIDAGSFNEQVKRMGNKAGVNWCSAMRLADEVFRTWGEQHPRVMIDRHGGRVHYREDLQVSFPEAEIRIVEENQRFSRYVLKEGGRMMTVNFSVESEAKHLPVALASMTAKLVRELWMERFNRWFCGHMPELKPTAGYREDGKRWMGDAEELIRGLGIKREMLVRTV